MQEILLEGGRITPGVVRIGNTVRRPRKDTSPYVRQALTLLHNAGFSACPQFFGFDEQGREMLEYIPGYVPGDLGETTVAQFFQFMPLIRSFHDASITGKDTTRVLCHNDLSPCNVVFSGPCREADSIPGAIIDWDSCREGERYEDLTYACWMWLDIGNKDNEPDQVAWAVEEGLRIYGAGKEERTSFIDKMLWRMNEVAVSFEREGLESVQNVRAWVNTCMAWTKEYLAPRIFILTEENTL